LYTRLSRRRLCGGNSRRDTLTLLPPRSCRLGHHKYLEICSRRTEEASTTGNVTRNNPVTYALNNDLTHVVYVHEWVHLRRGGYTEGRAPTPSYVCRSVLVKAFTGLSTKPSGINHPPEEHTRPVFVFAGFAVQRLLDC